MDEPVGGSLRRSTIGNTDGSTCWWFLRTINDLQYPWMNLSMVHWDDQSLEIPENEPVGGSFQRSIVGNTDGSTCWWFIVTINHWKYQWINLLMVHWNDQWMTIVVV
ncbi:unnamed protein product [Adineta ricciae]|uniref:Uncharacterized protein n=1 Tax=Adineta ricciae TaxID=249248 RepID=A0A815URG3_ADIRI|nr:unnamed protein product [Adineta ricciae]CAF1523436.1 unnamed protein product [Adineta ricciae]